MLTQVVAPTVLPVTLAEAKTYIRSEYDAEDALVTSIVSAACRAVQDMTGRAIGSQTWRYEIKAPNGRTRLRLPLVPVTSITSITYYDADDAEQTATVSDFYLYADDFKAELQPKADTEWPTTIERDDALRVQFVAGGSTPEPLVHAIRLLIGQWEPNRSASTEKQMHDLAFGLEFLTSQHKTAWVAA